MEGKQAMKQLTQPQNPGADLRGRELSSECGSSAGSLGLQHGIAKLLLWRNSHRHHEDKHAGNPPPPQSRFTPPVVWASQLYLLPYHLIPFLQWF